MGFAKRISKNIRKYKKEQKTSFLKIAKRADIPFTTLETILYKKREDLKVSTFLAIAKALGVKLDDLLK